MAKGRTKRRGGKGAGRPARGGGTTRRRSGNKLLLLLTLLALVPFSLPTMLVLFVGLLPTLAAAIGERGENRYAWACVGGLNFAGLVPWLFKLWFGHHTLNYAVELLLSVDVYLAAYGAAGAGWLLYLAMPPVVTTVFAASSQRRALGLASQQRRLVEEWGDEVTTAVGAEDPDDLLI